MILDDTSLLTLQVRYPNGTFAGFILIMIQSGLSLLVRLLILIIRLSINFKPYFPVDGEYEMIVTGKDKSNNTCRQYSNTGYYLR